jgi:hypothetical protein
VKLPLAGAGTGKTRLQSTQKSPTHTNTTSGSTLPQARMTAVRAPDFTPSTLIQVRTRSGTTIVTHCPAPERAAGHR